MEISKTTNQPLHFKKEKSKNLTEQLNTTEEETESSSEPLWAMFVDDERNEYFVSIPNDELFQCLLDNGLVVEEESLSSSNEKRYSLSDDFANAIADYMDKKIK